MPKVCRTGDEDWVRTRATLKQRKIVWKMRAERQGYKEIVNVLDKRKDKGEDMHLNRDTIRKVVDEAIGEPGIPPEMVRTLPPVVQAWIILNRPAIKDKVFGGGTGEQSVPSSVRDKHWEDLARAAGDLAENLWILLLQYRVEPNERLYPMYEINGNVVDGGQARMDVEAEGMWGEDYDSVVELKRINTHLASGLISHPGLSIGDWRDFTKDTISREIIHKLELAALRRTFNGTCKICE